MHRAARRKYFIHPQFSTLLNIQPDLYRSISSRLHFPSFFQVSHYRLINSSTRFSVQYINLCELLLVTYFFLATGSWCDARGCFFLLLPSGLGAPYAKSLIFYVAPIKSNSWFMSIKSWKEKIAFKMSSIRQADFVMYTLGDIRFASAFSGWSIAYKCKWSVKLSLDALLCITLVQCKSNALWSFGLIVCINYDVLIGNHIND